MPQRSDDYREYQLLANVSNDHLPPLVEWALVTGEILFNYKGALDQLVYTLAMLNTDLREPVDAGRLAFPIADSLPHFDDLRFRIGSLPDEAKQAIEELQPFNSDRFRDSPAKHPLSRLRDLHNIDKHRLLHYAVLNVRELEGSFTVGDDDISEQGGSIWITTEPLQHGEPLVIITFDEPTVLDDSQLRLGLRLGFYPNTDAAPSSKSLPDELNDIREEAIRIVNQLNPPLNEHPGSLPTAR